MRLLVKLKNHEEINKYETSHIRNFIYKNLQGSKWTHYHDKNKYKHFTFSNLFPFKERGIIDSDFNLIIVSPYVDLIYHLEKVLKEKPVFRQGEKIYPVIEIESLRASLSLHP